MRVFWVAIGLLTMVNGASSQKAVPAGQLVREVVYNELNDHTRHGYWRYWIERRSEAGTRVEEQVETREGPVAELELTNGEAPTPEAVQEDEERLGKLIGSPDVRARAEKQYDEDEERIARILAMLPTAFVYQYDGEENGSYRLRFKPNPEECARSMEARIFHAMSGMLWVNERQKRLERIEGRIDENVDFGFGLLGRLYKGGWFRLVRAQVSATEWKTESLEVHMNVRALVVKTFARDTSETRGGFAAVPEGMSLREGVGLLEGLRANSGALAIGQPVPAGVGAVVSHASLAFRER